MKKLITEFSEVYESKIKLGDEQLVFFTKNDELSKLRKKESFEMNSTRYEVICIDSKRIMVKELESINKEQNILTSLVTDYINGDSSKELIEEIESLSANLNKPLKILKPTSQNLFKIGLYNGGYQLTTLYLTDDDLIREYVTIEDLEENLQKLIEMAVVKAIKNNLSFDYYDVDLISDDDIDTMTYFDLTESGLGCYYINLQNFRYERIDN